MFIIQIYFKIYKVVVGIDFGSLDIRYDYSFNIPKKIEFGYFPGHSYEIKSLTQIILDSNLQNVLAFGKKCDISPKKDDDLYFKRIKMNIYNNFSPIKPVNNSKSFPFVTIITKILGYIKDEAIKKIHENKQKIEENQIK